MMIFAFCHRRKIEKSLTVSAPWHGIQTPMTMSNKIAMAPSFHISLSLTLSQTNMFPVASVHKRQKQNYEHVLPSLFTAQGANIMNDSGSVGRLGVMVCMYWNF